MHSRDESGHPKGKANASQPADVGSGTGALGLALAAARPGIKVYATDVSPAALANTRANVAALGLSSRVGVLEGPR